MTNPNEALLSLAVRRLSEPNCWLCGKYGHRPAPNCLLMYEVRQAASAHGDRG